MASEEFGPLLLQARKRAGLTQPQLAALISGEHVSFLAQQVSAWERGHYKPKDARTVERLEDALDIEDQRLSLAAGLVARPGSAAVEERLSRLEGQMAMVLAILRSRSAD